MRKRIQGALALILSLVMMCSLAAGASAARFIDVDPSTELGGYMMKMVDSGAFQGYADGTFRPTAPFTGKAAVLTLAREYWKRGYEKPAFDSEYVSALQFLFDRAEELGTYDDEFVNVCELQGPISRRDYAEILARTMERRPMIARYTEFTDTKGDVQLNNWIALLNSGKSAVISGYSDGSFRPNGGLTRQAAAKILCGHVESNIVPPTVSDPETEATVPEQDLIIPDPDPARDPIVGVPNPDRGRAGISPENPGEVQIPENGEVTLPYIPSDPLELYEALMGMNFSDTNLAAYLAAYMEWAGLEEVEIDNDGGDWKTISGCNYGGTVLGISLHDGECSTFRAAGNGMIGITAPKTVTTMGELLEEIDGFAGMPMRIETATTNGGSGNEYWGSLPAPFQEIYLG